MNFTVDAILNDQSSDNSSFEPIPKYVNYFLKKTEITKHTDTSTTDADNINTIVTHLTDNSISKKKQRNLFSKAQTTILRQYFNKKNYISASERESLAITTNLSPEQIKIWFQNNRYKMKNSYNYRAHKAMGMNPHEYNQNLSNLMMHSYGSLYQHGKPSNTIDYFHSHILPWRSSHWYGIESDFLAKSLKEAGALQTQIPNSHMFADWM